MTLAGRRYMQMVEALALEDRAANPDKPPDKDDPRLAWGWQTRVSVPLGIKQPQVSRLWGGAYEPTIDLIEMAQTGLKIDYRYFHEPKLTSPHFRDYIKPSTVPPMGYKAFRDFLEVCETLGISRPDPFEEQWLGRQEWPGEPQVMSYVKLLEAFRTLPPVETGVRPMQHASSQ